MGERGSHGGWIGFFFKAEIYSFGSFLEIYEVLKEITSLKFRCGKSLLSFGRRFLRI